MWFWRDKVERRPRRDFAGSKAVLRVLVVGLCSSGSLVTQHTEAAAITSIRQITGGQTIDFNTPGDPTALLASHQMQLQSGLVDNSPGGGFDPWVTGNPDAPAGGGNVYGTFRVRTTGAPWSAIGATGAYPVIGTGVEQPSADFRIRIFNQAGAEIGNLVRTFHASPEDDSIDEIRRAYNAATPFLGFSSGAPPIYSVEFSRVDGNTNIYWDSFTFVPAPEPSALAAGGLAIAALLTSRRR